MKNILNIFFSILVSFIYGISIMLAVLAVVIYIYGRDLPDYNQLTTYVPPQTTKIYSSDEKFITSFSKEKRVYIPLEQIPKVVINAFLSAEDKNFYQNYGVDPVAILRSVLIITKNGSLVGGSTITQQLVKNFLLTPEKTIKRKIRELILSFRITRAFNKDKILELYLNKIYLGNGTYGVETAALGYFGKSTEEIDINEAAILASLPKSPNKLNPWKKENEKKIINRKNWVINRMLEDGYINVHEAYEARKMGLNLKKISYPFIGDTKFVDDEISKEIISMYGYNALYEGGLSIISTILPKYQEVAARALRSGIEKYDKRCGWRGATINIAGREQEFDSIHDSVVANINDHNIKLALVDYVKNDEARIIFKGGKFGFIKTIDWIINTSSTHKKSSKVKGMDDLLNVGDVIFVESDPNKLDEYFLKQIPDVDGAIVVLDTKTSKVLAMVGGYNYNNSQFNRATQAKRQTGSVFKTFVYLTAFQNGFTPATIIDDSKISIDQGYNLPSWTPKNYNEDYIGAVTARQGFEMSKNMVTIKLALLSGIDNIIKTANNFSMFSTNNKNLSIILGAENSTLLSVTNAYAMLANGCRKAEPSFIETIQNNEGKIIFRRDKRLCDECIISETLPNFSLINYIPPEPIDNRKIIADPIACYQTVSLLEGAITRGNGIGAKINGKHIGGKTGTTNNSNDAWFIGFTNEVTVGIYVGYDEPKSMGRRETGSRIAIPIFKQFIENIIEDIKGEPFIIPVGVNLIKVNRYTGLKTAEPVSDSVILETFRIEDEKNDFEEELN